MASWKWWHLALVWLGAIVVAIAVEWRQGNRFRARATLGGGLVGVRTPFSLRALLALIFIALIVATVMWFRTRNGDTG